MFDFSSFIISEFVVPKTIFDIPLLSSSFANAAFVSFVVVFIGIDWVSFLFW